MYAHIFLLARRVDAFLSSGNGRLPALPVILTGGKRKKVFLVLLMLNWETNEFPYTFTLWREI